MSVCVVGRGKVGRSLQRALVAAGVESTLLRGHPFRAPTVLHQTYVLAVPDDRIHAIAEQLAGAVRRNTIALHCAGARDLSELGPLSARGVHVALFHPLVSFAHKASASLAGATFTIFGDSKAVAEAKRLARKLAAHAVVLPATGSRARAAAYHAAAALVANGAAALAFHGVQVLLTLGFERREAERALAALLASVAHNISAVGVPRGLTGPVARGDSATVERHLRALAGRDRKALRAYAAVQPLIVESALAAGLDPTSARAILKSARARLKQ